MKFQIKLFFIVFLVFGIGADVGAVVAFINGENTGGIIALALGGVFSAVGIIGLVIQARGEAKLNLLKQTGRKTVAKVVSAEYNMSMTFNGRNPRVLLCEAKEKINGKMIIFRSANYWDQHINPVGSEIDVYYDSRNDEYYAVDLKSIRQG